MNKYDDIMCLIVTREPLDNENIHEEVTIYSEYPLNMEDIIYELLTMSIRRKKDSEKGLIVWTTAKNKFKELYD